MLKDYYKEPRIVSRLWVHEAERVFRDRLVNESDMAKFDEFRFAVTKKFFDDCGGVMQIEERPLLYCSFLQVRRPCGVVVTEPLPLAHGVHTTALPTPKDAPA